MAMLGVPYGVLIKDNNAVTHARIQAAEVAAEIEASGGPPASETQDTKAIALIAYIKRLGVDIFKDEPSQFVLPERAAAKEADHAND